MEKQEAMRVFINHFSCYGVRALRYERDEIDDIDWWTCEIFDPYLEEGADTIAIAQFAEHWPEVQTDWL